jgi:hypothetical protein
MKKPDKLLVLALLIPAMAFVFSCGPDDESEDADPVPIVLKVFPGSEGGYGASVIPSKSGAGWRIPYPGVTCYRANHIIHLEDVVISGDGSMVSFYIASRSAKAIDMLWLRLSTSLGTTMATMPQVTNGRGEDIYVIGPVDALGRVLFSLKVNPPGPDGYSLFFDFLDVKERIAYSSDRANPGVSDLEEIFTIDHDGTGIFQVTRDSPNITTYPVWSPGGEWIAFEQLLPFDCSGKILNRSQVFIVHPDGSNFTRVSQQSMFMASSPTFNPTGELLAYDCRPKCEGDPDTTVNICIYDLRTQSREPLFSGVGYFGDQLRLPRWSPDGNIMVMKGNTVTRSGLEIPQYVYAPMDPVTGDSLGSPTPFIKSSKKGLWPDGHYYKLNVWDLAWAPDSRHMVVNCNLLWRNPITLRYKVVFTGVAIFDFKELIQKPSIPTVPEITKVAYPGDGPPNFPAFNKTGDQLFFDRYHDNNWCDIQYIELNDYIPVVERQREVFLADGFFNRVPGLIPPAPHTFFPLGP